MIREIIVKSCKMKPIPSRTTEITANSWCSVTDDFYLSLLLSPSPPPPLLSQAHNSDGMQPTDAINHNNNVRQQCTQSIHQWTQQQSPPLHCLENFSLDGLCTRSGFTVSRRAPSGGPTYRTASLTTGGGGIIQTNRRLAGLWIGFRI